MTGRRFVFCALASTALSACVQQHAGSPAIAAPPPPVSAISDRVSGFEGEIAQLNEAVVQDRQALDQSRQEREQLSSSFYQQVSAIEARLQAGTTPGNPELTASWTEAQSALSQLDDSVSKLSDLSAKISADVSAADNLATRTRAAFSLPGALEADHATLADIHTQATIDSQLLAPVASEVAYDVTSQTDALTNQHHSLLTLSSEIEAGQLLGPGAAAEAPPPASASDSVAAAERPPAVEPKPTQARAPARHISKNPIVIGADQSPAQYEPKLYQSISALIKQSPNLSISLVGVLPAGGPPTSQALAAEAVRRKSDAVARALVSYGIPRDHIYVSASKSGDEAGGEVWIYPR